MFFSSGMDVGHSLFESKNHVFFSETTKNGGKRNTNCVFSHEKFISHSLENTLAVYLITIYTRLNEMKKNNMTGYIGVS